MVRAVAGTDGGRATTEAALEPRPAHPSGRGLLSEVGDILLRHEWPAVIVADVAGRVRIAHCIGGGRHQPLRARGRWSIHPAKEVVGQRVLRGEPPVVLQRRRGLAGCPVVVAER